MPMQYSLRALFLVMTATCVELVICPACHDLVYRTIGCTLTWMGCEMGEPFPPLW